MLNKFSKVRKTSRFPLPVSPIESRCNLLSPPLMLFFWTGSLFPALIIILLAFLSKSSQEKFKCILTFTVLGFKSPCSSSTCFQSCSIPFSGPYCLGCLSIARYIGYHSNRCRVESLGDLQLHPRQ